MNQPVTKEALKEKLKLLDQEIKKQRNLYNQAGTRQRQAEKERLEILQQLAEMA